MAEKRGWTPTLRMKQLPKAEYFLMKEMIAAYNLDDPSELFTVLLRLAAEVERYQDGLGTDWLLRVVAEHRASKQLEA